jgi:aminopeptidase N
MHSFLYSLLFSIILFGCGSTIPTTNLEDIKISANKNRSVNLYRATKPRYVDLLHTKLSLIPIWKSAQMKGDATLTMKPYFYDVDTMDINAKSMDIFSIEVKIHDRVVPITFTYDTAIIHIKFSRKLTAKDTFVLHIKYTANPNAVAKGGSKAIKEDKGLYFINHDGKSPKKPMHLWTQGETQANSCWFPTIDIPNEKHTQEIYITVEDKFKTLSNGLLINSVQNNNGTRTDYWKQDKPHAVYLSVLCVGDYTIVKDTWRGKEVSYYMEPKYEAMARPIFGRTPLMMEFFSKKLGVDFPWDKYAQIIVHEFVAGAMENTSAVTFNKFVQKDTRELLDNNDDQTVAHELCHHWFGDLVTCESWSHLPLNESFANYSEYLWEEHYLGRATADVHKYNDNQGYYKQANQKPYPLIRHDYDSQEDMFDVLSYNKGGSVLHHLRKTVGDEAFFKSITLYLKRYAYKTAEVSDLRKCFEEVTGLDYNWFFDQWFYKGGHPVLEFSYSRSDSGIRIMTSQKHSIDDYFLYSLPLEVDFYSENSKVTKAIHLTHARDTFFFRFNQKISFVNIDPEKSLIAKKIDHKSMYEWSAQFKRAPLLLDKLEALSYFEQNKKDSDVQKIYRSGINSPFAMVAIDCIKNIKLKPEDSGLVEKMKTIAKSHKISNVRVAAIDKLVKSDATAHKKLFIQLLNDSSYKVESAALNALNTADDSLGFVEAKKRTDATNNQVRNAVFTILSQKADSSYFEFFKSKAAEFEEMEKAFFLPHLATFIAKKNDVIYVEGMKIINDFKNENAEEWFGKYAFQTSISNILREISVDKTEKYKMRKDSLTELQKEVKHH